MWRAHVWQNKIKYKKHTHHTHTQQNAQKGNNNNKLPKHVPQLENCPKRKKLKINKIKNTINYNILYVVIVYVRVS